MKKLLMFSGILISAAVLSVTLNAKTASTRSGKGKARTKPAKQYKIEDYTFQWLVAQQAKARLVVIKDQDSTTVRIDRDFDSISVTPAEAEAIAKALVNTEEYHKRMRAAKKEVSETVKAGKYNVHFNYSPKTGFDVWVRSADAFGRSVWLDRKQALAFQPWLAQAVAMAAYVDAKIRP